MLTFSAISVMIDGPQLKSAGPYCTPISVFRKSSNFLSLVYNRFYFTLRQRKFLCALLGKKDKFNQGTAVSAIIHVS